MIGKNFWDLVFNFVLLIFSNNEIKNIVFCIAKIVIHLIHNIKSIKGKILSIILKRSWFLYFPWNRNRSDELYNQKQDGYFWNLLYFSVSSFLLGYFLFNTFMFFSWQLRNLMALWYFTYKYEAFL